MVLTTSLVVHFFLRPHLLALTAQYDVTLVLNRDSDSYAPLTDLPVRIISVGIMRTITPVQDLRCIWQLYRLFRRERFDQIWATVPKAGLVGMAAARLARIPSRVFVFQGETWATRQGVMRWILQAVDRLTVSCSTHLLAVSHSERQLLEDERIVPCGQVQVLGAGSICGVDLQRFKPDADVRAAIRAGLNIPADGVVALYLGRLKAEKGVHELSAAFAQVQTAQPLYLLYVGPDEEDIAAQLAQDHPRIRMVGYTNRPQDYMAAADFICLPSHREGFGMVIIEAAACGIPAIGSHVSGVSDAIAQDVTGLQFPVGNVEQLAAALTRMTDDRQLRQRMGDAARARVVQLFEQGTVVDRYIRYFVDAL